MGASPGKESLPIPQIQNLPIENEEKMPEGAKCPESSPNAIPEGGDVAEMSDSEQDECLRALFPFLDLTSTVDAIDGEERHEKSKEQLHTSNSKGEPAPIWVRAGEYSLTPYWRHWALTHLGVTPSNLVADLFTRHVDVGIPLGLTRTQNAFAYDWGNLSQGEGNFLWANPPFQILFKVLAKVCINPCRVVLLCPVREEATWWPFLQAMPMQRVLLPSDTCLFFGAVKKDVLPPPRWRVMVCFLDSTKGGFPEPPKHLAKQLQKENEGWGLTHLCENSTVEKAVPQDEKNMDQATSSVNGICHCPPQESVEMEENHDPTRKVEVIAKVAMVKNTHGEKRMRIPVTLRVDEKFQVECNALIDTGSEVNLFRKGLIPHEYTHQAEAPIKLMAANHQCLDGGKSAIRVLMDLQGVGVENHEKEVLTSSTLLYEAALGEDVILSYNWLARRKLDIYPHHHALRGKVNGVWYHIPAIKESTEPVPLDGRETVYAHAISAMAQPSLFERPRALELFCGTKSVAKVLEKWGFEVVTFDCDPKRNPTICENILTWQFRDAFPPGYFAIVAASPPCTEYSAVKTRGIRDLETADRIVKRTLKIIKYFAPPVWWLETPRYGMLAHRGFMARYPRVDVDYCQFEDCGFQKPTRFFGSAHLKHLSPVKCDQCTCKGLLPLKVGEKPYVRPHRLRMGGPERGVNKELAYHIPEGVVEYVAGLTPQVPIAEVEVVCKEGERLFEEGESEEFIPLTPEIIRVAEELRFWQIRCQPDVPLECEGEEEEMEVLLQIANYLQEEECLVATVGGPEGLVADTSPLATELKEKLMEEFGKTSLSGEYLPDPPVRGPFGEAEINLRPDAVPVNRPPFHIMGERRQALIDLVRKAREAKKLEPGVGAWNTPAFPVPKPSGKYRLVQDLRPLNDATIKDGHPLPRIEEILIRQGQCDVWSTMDLVDGFHQMPLKEAHRPLTCMGTPEGTMQWRVLVMGLKNAPTQFQRFMEWMLAKLKRTDPYIDDVIAGAKGENPEDGIRKNYEEVRTLLKKFEEEKMVANPAKSAFFQREVQFCGHILREGRRSPAPGKLGPIQNWPLPATVTQLRGFLGLTNYYSGYLRHYAEIAAPLMSMLCLSKEEGKKGSTLRLIWNDVQKRAFAQLREALCGHLELWHIRLDEPFQLWCDASGVALGADLRQFIEEAWRTVALYSRKFARSQLNWTPREKETYAIVAALRKWAGIIGFQPVEVLTDHRSLEHWHTEHVDTPSGPSGRRARWHGTLSRFDLEIKYVPGPENVVADAMSRWAYPACVDRDDVTIHGSARAKEEVKLMEEQERRHEKEFDEKTVNIPFIAVWVITRSGKVLEPEGEESSPGDDVPPVETRASQNENPVSGEVSPSETTTPPEKPSPEENSPENPSSEVENPKSQNGGEENEPNGVGKIPPFSLPMRMARPRPPIPPIPPPGMEWLRDGVGQPPPSLPQEVEGTAGPERDAADLPAPMSQPRRHVAFQHGLSHARASKNAKPPKFRKIKEGKEKEPWDPKERIPGEIGWQVRDQNAYTKPTPRLSSLRRTDLSQPWEDDYAASLTFSEIWSKVHLPNVEWPENFQVLGGKLYHFGKLCIPESRVWGVCSEYHESEAHLASRRLKEGMELRYEFPDGVDIFEKLEKVRKNCLICQKCQVPNWALKQPVVMTPIPPRVFFSVSLDIFSMPEVEYEGQKYNCFVLCVDRHSGWMLARPTQKLGLTAEKAARLLIDFGWVEIGIPAVITSDQGTEFASQWWMTMCQRLGIRQAFSQAHRPQANGRAEVAGRVLQDILRKMNLTSNINWVEALPRALRIHQDCYDPVIGMSPYQCMFGRERNLGAVPPTYKMESRDAAEFFDHMTQVDIKVAKALNHFHQKVAKYMNAKRHARPPYKIGDWVFVKRPKGVGGHKLETWWRGPFEVLGRKGADSYIVRDSAHGPLEVHADQLKFCVWEKLDDQGVPLQYPPPTQPENSENSEN